jgi:Flp pilus assembly protein TadG
MSPFATPLRRPPIVRVQGPGACRGAAAVEFALVSLVFFTLLIAVAEFGRLSYYWNTAAEMTRLGARMAIVCDKDATQIKARMAERLPLLSASDIVVTYSPNGCDVNSCQFATVSIAATTFQTTIPFVPLSLVMPAFTTTLPRESMQSTFSGTANPVCS